MQRKFRQLCNQPKTYHLSLTVVTLRLLLCLKCPLYPLLPLQLQQLTTMLCRLCWQHYSSDQGNRRQRMLQLHQHSTHKLHTFLHNQFRNPLRNRNNMFLLNNSTHLKLRNLHTNHISSPDSHTLHNRSRRCNKHPLHSQLSLHTNSTCKVCCLA